MPHRRDVLATRSFPRPAARASIGAMYRLAALLCLSLLLPRLAAQTRTDLREAVTAYAADLRDLGRRYDVPLSGERRQRLRDYLRQRQQELQALPAADLG